MSAEWEVAVVGAGVAGASAARTLAACGQRVVVIDKARGPGGRCSTRRSEAGGFDHGAQYFTVRDPDFATAIASPPLAEVVALWRGRIGVHDAAGWTQAPDHERWVAVPGMSALPRRLLGDLDARFGTAVARLERLGDSWSLLDVAGDVLVRARSVLLTAPPAQSLALLGAHAPTLAALCASVVMQPCWAVLARFAARLPTEWDGAFINTSALSWCARDSGRPGRAPGERWVLHAGADWSAAHVEDDPRHVAERMLEEFRRVFGIDAMPVEPPAAHRWRYALAERPLAVDAGWDADARLAIAGDWLAGSRIEGAWRSGRAAAEIIAGSR